MAEMTTFFDAHDVYVAKAARGTAGDITYSNGALLGDLISMSVTPDVQTFSHTAEHAGKRTIYKCYGANVTLNHEPIAPEKREMLYGHQLSETDELLDNITDEPGMVGVTYYKDAMDGSFEGVFLPLVRFAEGTDDANAALDSPQFVSPTTTGSAEIDKDGNYRIRKRFTSRTEVQAWCKSKLNITQ